MLHPPLVAERKKNGEAREDFEDKLGSKIKGESSLRLHMFSHCATWNKSKHPREV